MAAEQKYLLVATEPVCKVVHCIFVRIKIKKKLTPCGENKSKHLPRPIPYGRHVMYNRILCYVCMFSHDYNIKRHTSCKLNLGETLVPRAFRSATVHFYMCNL